MATSGPELAVAYVSISASTKGLGKDIAKAMGAPEIAKQGEKAGKTVSDRMGGVLKKGALATGAAVGGLIGTSLVKGFKRLNAIDQAEAKLRGLGHSAKQVQGIMGNALASVKGTAFGLDEAATTAGAVVAAGIKPGKQLTTVLKTVADTATIAGTSMSDMGAIFGSVAARGKLQGDDLMQLTSRGVPVLAFLAKHYGITAKAASKMVTDGKVDFKNFAAAMKENIGGAALDSGKTVQGAWKNLWASISRIGANALSGVFPKLQKAFVGLTDFLGPVEDKAKSFGQAVGSGIKNATDAVKTFVNAFRGKGDVGGKWMVPMVEAGVKARNVFNRLKDAFGQLWDAAKPIGPAMVKIGKALLPIFQGAGESAKDSGPGILAAAFSLLKLAVKGLAAILQGIADFATKHGTAFRRMAVGVTAAVIAYKALSAAMRIQMALEAAGGLLKYLKGMKLVQAATKVWAVLQWALNAALNANPISLIIIGLVALGAALVIAYKKSDTFRRIVNAAWNGIKTAAVAVFHWFTRTFIPFFTKTLPDAWHTLTSTTSRAWDTLKTKSQSAIRWIVDKFLGFAESIVKGAAKAFGWVPGIGPKLRTAASKFADFRDSVNAKLGGIKDQSVDIVTRYNIKGPSANQQAAKLAGMGYATGGAISGPGSGTSDSIPARLSNGEHVWTAREVQAAGGQAAMYQMRRAVLSGAQHFASGGAVFNVRTSGLKSAEARFESLAEDVGGVTSRLAAALKKKLMTVVAGLGGGPHMTGSYRALEALVKPWGAIITSAFRPGARTTFGNLSRHAMGKAIDIAPNHAIWERLYAMRGRLFELLGPWGMFREGRPYYDPTVAAMHKNHIHISTYDQGGILPPGLTLAYNGTGKNETIRTHEQESGQFPKKLALVVGGREFEAYLTDHTDSRITRAGQRSAVRV